MEQGNVDKTLDARELWSPATIAGVADCEIKVARIEGVFDWHAHAATQEFFLVLAGTLTMEFRDRTEVLEVGDYINVPAGIEHRPAGTAGTRIMLVERAGTTQRGDAAMDVTGELKVDPRHR